MDAHVPALDPIGAQQLVAQYAAMLEQHEQANAWPASVSTLPAPKPVIRDAIRITTSALAATGQLTPELIAFLEGAFVALANYVDPELANLAAEHRAASAALEHDPRQPGERLASPNWTVVARTSRLAGEIARASAEEAAALRQEFQVLLDEKGVGSDFT